MPVLVVIPSNEIERKSYYFELGAVDVFIYSLPQEELLLRIHHCIVQSIQAEELAFFDPLTKVYNRRFFEHQIFLEVQRAHRNQSCLSICFIDLDHFKRINDTFGHNVGDLVLQEFAAFMKLNLRLSDILARYGGEEFVIIFPEADETSVYKKMEDILNRLQVEHIVEHEGEKRFITFSAGVCQYESDMTVQEWIKSADDAAYKAKESGRNQIVIASGKNNITDVICTKHCILLAEWKVLHDWLNTINDSITLDIYKLLDDKSVLELLEQKNIDICVIHIQNNSINAFDMLDTITKRYSHIKVLMISTEPNDSFALQSFSLGAHNYMQTPIDPIDIEIAIHHLLL